MLSKVRQQATIEPYEIQFKHLDEVGSWGGSEVFDIYFHFHTDVETRDILLANARKWHKLNLEPLMVIAVIDHIDNIELHTRSILPFNLYIEMCQVRAEVPKPNTPYGEYLLFAEYFATAHQIPCFLQLAKLFGYDHTPDALPKTTHQ
jgi:hypothetical protein